MELFALVTKDNKRNKVFRKLLKKAPANLIEQSDDSTSINLLLHKEVM